MNAGSREAGKANPSCRFLTCVFLYLSSCKTAFILNKKEPFRGAKNILRRMMGREELFRQKSGTCGARKGTTARMLSVFARILRPLLQVKRCGNDYSPVVPALRPADSVLLRTLSPIKPLA